MTSSVIYPRFAEARLLEALADTPVVLIHGPRQCGKTTLAQSVGEREGYAGNYRFVAHAASADVATVRLEVTSGA